MGKAHLILFPNQQPSIEMTNKQPKNRHLGIKNSKSSKSPANYSKLLQLAKGWSNSKFDRIIILRLQTDNLFRNSSHQSQRRPAAVQSNSYNNCCVLLHDYYLRITMIIVAYLQILTLKITSRRKLYTVLAAL